MTQSRGRRWAAGLSVWPLVLAGLLAGCSGAHSLPLGAGHPSGSPRPVATPSAGPARSEVALESLRMVSPQAGWAVAVDRNGYPIAVVRTADGGRSWRAAGPRGLNGHDWYAAFYSARDAWLTWSNPRRRAWSVTYRTTDGGGTWVRMGSIPMATLGASAPDMVTARLGWVTAGLGVAAGSSGIAIFQTTDGGSRWRLVELTDYNRHTPGAIPFGCDKGFAVFSSAATGWVTGICSGDRTAFWASRDGGRTWRYQPLPPPSGHGTLAGCQCYLTAPVFTSAQNGAVWGTGIPVLHDAVAAAGYLTHDGGRTWAPIALQGGRVPVQTPDFVDGQHGFVLGGRLSRRGQTFGEVQLYATTDGGATWAARSSSPLFGQAIRAGQVTLDFLTPATGFASLISYNPLRSYLLETRTGGATWTSVPASVTGRT